MIFVALGLLSFFQGRARKTTAMGSSANHVMVKAMQARLSGVSESITSYLQTHKASDLERIQSEGREAGRLLEGLRSETSGVESNAAYERIKTAQEQMREATVHVLAMDRTEMNDQQTLEQSSAALLALLTEKMRPSIKSNQPYANGRLRAVRAALAAMSNFPDNQSRFEKSMDTFANLSETRRASRWAEDAKMLFAQCVRQAQTLQNTVDQKKAALDRFHQSRTALEAVLRENDRGRAAGFGSRMLASGFAYSLLAGLLVCGGIGLVLLTFRRTERELVKPLQDVLQCVEAAAAGDLSRTPDHWSADEVGQLSQAAGRLISVLARSENLVYHLAALVESSGEAIISHNLEGTILSWNKGAQRIYGYSAEEVKGKSITILSPDDEGEEMMRHLLRIRNGERIQPFETIHKARNGRTVKAFVRVSAILDSTRKVIGASFCAQDLTETGLLSAKALEGSPHA